MGKSILTRQLKRRFQALGARWLDACLPSTCLLCGAPGATEPLCPACAAELPALPAPHCPLCLNPTPYGERCGACLQQPPRFDHVIALYAYAFPVDRLVHQLKYAARFSLARHWGMALAARLDSLGTPVSRVMPVPLHHERLAERGYNQSLEIARRLASALDLRLDYQNLVKTHATRPQAELPLAARQRNLQDAFACLADLEGEHVLLVDDVLTSGATLDAAARVLKQHGARAVSVCVVARTLRH